MFELAFSKFKLILSLCKQFSLLVFQLFFQQVSQLFFQLFFEQASKQFSILFFLQVFVVDFEYIQLIVGV
jgi:hypothetical protein